MTERWLPIRYYRDFYDIPRAFVVESAGEQFLFDCPFSEALDDYADEYTIYRISDELRDRIDLISWINGSQFERIGAVPITVVTFDATKRCAISAKVLEGFRRR